MNTFRSPAYLRFVVLLTVIIALLPLRGRAGNFDSAIAAFEANDAIYPPPVDPVLVVGSSTIAAWGTLVTDFPQYPMMNRGFGGSQMSDVLYYFDRVVAVYKPALIVVYEGDNDITVKPVDEVFADFTNFLARVSAQLPSSDVAFISVKPSPSRVAYLEQARDLNTRIQTLCDGTHVRYIDVFTPMLDANGQPRPELFISDMLHMNATGYALWKSIVGPQLDRWRFGTIVPTLEPQQFLVDFGAAETAMSSDLSNHWNNVTPAVGTSSIGALPNLVNTQGRLSMIGLRMIRPFNNANGNGTLDSGLYPSAATQDSLFGNTELWGTLSDVFPCFKLTGLDPGWLYNIRFYASRMSAGDNRETRYTVAGAATNAVALNVADNISQSVGLSNLTCDAQGEISVSLTPGPNNNNPYHFTYLGVMELRAVFVPKLLPVQCDGQTVKVDWVGAGILESAPSAEGPWTALSPQPMPGYSEPVLTGQGRFFRLRMAE